MASGRTRYARQRREGSMPAEPSPLPLGVSLALIAGLSAALWMGIIKLAVFLL